MGKPFIAFAVSNAVVEGSSAITNLFFQVQRQLKNSDGELVSAAFPRGRVIAKADVVVCDSASSAFEVHREVGTRKKIIPLIHSFENATRRAIQLSWLKAVAPSLVIVTSDNEVCEDVRAQGYKATHIPITFNSGRFYHLPYPSIFTIGYIGANLAHKRFNAIDNIGKDLDIPVVGSRRMYHSGGEYEGRELEFYGKISCYVCATTCEKAPFPTAEALLCGRPVVSTPILTSPIEVVECINRGAGRLTDELAAGVLKVKERFEECAAVARTFTLRDTSSDYEKAILSTLHEDYR